MDLSQAVSKSIGETEKNLAAVRERAERRQWLLVFDEADALFGKRSKPATPKTAPPTRRSPTCCSGWKTFHGVVILATNLPANLDEPFLRRFESVVYFPLPGPEQQLRLWREAFSPLAQLEVDLEAIAERHVLSGGLILHVVRRVSLWWQRTANMGTADATGKRSAPETVRGAAGAAAACPPGMRFSPLCPLKVPPAECRTEEDMELRSKRLLPQDFASALNANPPKD